MKLYTCKLRLAGNVLNEVIKSETTAAEIEIFRFIHGSDSVLDIKETGEAQTALLDDEGNPNGKTRKRTSADERKRLKHLYANEERLNSHQLKLKNEMLRNLFGHDRMPLPEDLAEVAGPELEEDEADAPAPVVRRTRVAKPTAPADTPAFAE
jgi:hypothetical protein